MISSEVIRNLVPRKTPDFERRERFRDYDFKRSDNNLAIWSEFLRAEIRKNEIITSDLIKNTGFIATGIIHSTYEIESRSEETVFPAINGFQFGAALLRSSRPRDFQEDLITDISLGDYGEVPLIQLEFGFSPHVFGSQIQSVDGHVAAVYKENNHCFGLTADHIVSSYQIGQKVPIICSDCGQPAILTAPSPGVIDAAKVLFPCGGPYNVFSTRPNLMPAKEGDQISLNLGSSGKVDASIMASLSTGAEIISAVAPKHFLTNVSGVKGDSGSLVSDLWSGKSNPPSALVGMYLGSGTGKRKDGSFHKYGYGLDLQQVSDIFFASDLEGEFNV